MPQADAKRVKKAIVWVLFNQHVVAFLVMYPMIRLYEWRGCDFGRELPTFHWVLFEIAVFALVEEVAFYYSHRFVTRVVVTSEYTLVVMRYFVVLA